MYKSTKHYGHEQGFSAVFRQHRATHSHCSLLHGYALAFTFVFAAKTLDERNWVVDFGALDGLKQALRDSFDHVLVVAQDDPALSHMQHLGELGLANVLVLPAVGCEAFAAYAHALATRELHRIGQGDRVVVESVEVREHAGNSAVYAPQRAPGVMRRILGQGANA